MSASRITPRTRREMHVPIETPKAAFVRRCGRAPRARQSPVRRALRPPPTTTAQLPLVLVFSGS
jgi:hypothetical protein